MDCQKTKLAHTFREMLVVPRGKGGWGGVMGSLIGSDLAMELWLWVW